VPGPTSYDDITNKLGALSQGLEWWFNKIGPTLQGAGHWGSLWYAAGSPGAGADPAGTPGTVRNNAAGAMNWGAQNPNFKNALSFGGVPSLQCTVCLYDRLVDVGGIVLSSTGAKTVNSSALSRYATTWAGVEAWIEVTTATTTTACVVNMSSYTNDDASPAGSRAGPNLTFPAAATVQRYMAMLPLQSGDHGVRSVQNLTVVTACTAGVANIVLLKRLGMIGLAANMYNERDFILQIAKIPRIWDSQSLAMMIKGNAATAITIDGSVQLVWG